MELDILKLKSGQKVWVQSRWSPGVRPCEVTVRQTYPARTEMEKAHFTADHGDDAGSPNSFFYRAWDSRASCAQYGSLHLWGIAKTAQEDAEAFDREYLA